MHASTACLLLYEDYVWVSLGNAIKPKQSKQLQNEAASHSEGAWKSSMMASLRAQQLRGQQLRGKLTAVGGAPEGIARASLLP
jgi:hypothetical protein